MATLSVSSDLTAILSDAQIRVSFEIGPGGILAELRDAKTGDTIGGLDDLAHFQGARSFVTQERKDLSSEDGLDEQAAMILCLAEEIQETDSDWKLPAEIPSDFIVYLKQSARACHALQKNLEIINGLKTDETSQKESFEVISTMAEKIIAVEMQLLKVFLKEGKLEKGAKQTLLLQNGVPKWFVNKLQGPTLAVDKDANINRVLFPPAHRSWLNLTLEEWRSAEVQKNLRPISQYSKWLITVLGSNDFLREFCMLGADINLGDKTIPVVSKLFEGKLTWIPHCLGYHYCLEPVSKNKDQGFWPFARFNNPAETIQSLSQAIGRLATTMICSADVLSSFWAKVFPSIKFDRSKITRGNNIQKIALDQQPGDQDARYLALFGLESDEWKELFVQQLCEQMNAGIDSSQYLALNRFVIDKPITGTFSGQGEDYKHQTKFVGARKLLDVFKKLNGLFDVSSTQVQVGKIRDLRESFATKRAKTRPMAMLPKSTLGKDAQEFLLKDLKVLKNDPLRQKMREWLMAFSSRKMQRASVKLLRAHFDEFFNRDLIVAESVHSDSEDAESDVDSG